MPPLEIAASQWNQPMTLNLDDCKDLMRFEMAFTRLLQIKQRPDIYEPDYYFRTADGILKPPKNSPPPPKAQKQQQPGQQQVHVQMTDEQLRARLKANFQQPKPQNNQNNHQQTNDASQTTSTTEKQT